MVKRCFVQIVGRPSSFYELTCGEVNGVWYRNLMRIQLQYLVYPTLRHINFGQPSLRLFKVHWTSSSCSRITGADGVLGLPRISRDFQRLNPSYPPLHKRNRNVIGNRTTDSGRDQTRSDLCQEPLSNPPHLPPEFITRKFKNSVLFWWHQRCKRLHRPRHESHKCASPPPTLGYFWATEIEFLRHAIWRLRFPNVKACHSATSKYLYQRNQRSLLPFPRTDRRKELWED